MGERPERVRRRVRRVAATSSILLFFVLVLPVVAQAGPSIALSPDKGPVGTEITIEGRGFAAHQPVTLLLDHLVLVDAVTSDESGSFTAQVSVPPTRNGPHQVVAEAVLNRASARFIVQGPEPTTTSTTSSTSTTTTPSTTSSTTTTSAPTTTAAAAAPTTTSTTAAPTTTSTTTRSHTSTTTTTGTDTRTPNTDTTATTPPTPAGDDTSTDSTENADTGSSTPPSTAGSTTSPDSPTTTASPESDGPTPATAAPSSPELAPGLVNGALWGLGGEDAAPDLSGVATIVESLSVTPAAAPVGASVNIVLDFEEAVPGLSRVQIMMDDVTMGDPVPVHGLSLSIRRHVPDLAPGGHQITVVDDGGVLARSDFSILEPESTSRTLMLLGLGGLAIGLGWQAVRRGQDWTLPSSVVGLWDDLHGRFNLWRDEQR